MSTFGVAECTICEGGITAAAVGTKTIADGSRPGFRLWLNEFSVMRGCSQFIFFFGANFILFRRH